MNNDQISFCLKTIYNLSGTITTYLPCNDTCPPGCERVYNGLHLYNDKPRHWLSKAVFVPGSGSDLTYVPSPSDYWYPFLKASVLMGWDDRR